MNLTEFLTHLAYYVVTYSPEQLDLSLKAKDLSEDLTIRKIEFDFIIVGGGSAGCILANRLTENPNWKVLLIEAGIDGEYETDVPLFGGQFTNTKYDWNFTTVPQKTVCQDTGGICSVPQGHIFGGSSSIGDMLYIRGKRKDYDEWAKSGNQGWSYKDVLPYFLKAENQTIPEYMNLPYHSTKGPLPIAFAEFNNSIVKKFMDSAIEYGISEIDVNNPDEIGEAYAQLNLMGNRRCSSCKAYLDPIRNRTNLYVFKNTIATKILFSKEGDKQRVSGVSCVTNDEEYDVTAKKEVILSAGAINTPKLLMLSGIGPKKHLEELGIPVIADLPVGQHLVDQAGILFTFGSSNEDINYDDHRLIRAIFDYAKGRKGLLSAPRWLVLGICNTAAGDAQSKELLPDVLYGGGILLPFQSGADKTSVVVSASLLQPLSEGTVKLSSAKFKDQPLIDPNYFHSKIDLKHVLEQIGIEMGYINGKTWANDSIDFKPPPECIYKGKVADDFVQCYIKYNSYLGLYPSSTARMGPSTDVKAVVGADLKVHSIENLRIVDASVIPHPVRAPPYATVVMIAEKAADLIKTVFKTK